MKRVFLVIPAIGLILSNAAFGDTVVLKSGKRIEGTIVEKTDQYVKVDNNGKPLYFENKYIESVIPGEGRQALMQSGYSYLQQGLALANGENLVEAEEMFKKGAEADPADKNCRGARELLTAVEQGRITREYALSLLKGSYYLQKQEYPAAISHLQDALRINPGDIDVCYNLACAYMNINEQELAVKYLSKVLEARVEDAEAYSLRGSIYYIDGNLEKAKGDFLIAAELFKKNGETEKSEQIRQLLEEL
jgi:tetratricopeptide (TPR) repeat protein